MRPSSSKDAPRTPEARKAEEQAIHARTVETLKTEIADSVHKPEPDPPIADRIKSNAQAHADTVAMISREMQKREPIEDKRRREAEAQARDIEWIKRDMQLKNQTRVFSGGYVTPDE